MTVVEKVGPGQVNGTLPVLPLLPVPSVPPLVDDPAELPVELELDALELTEFELDALIVEVLAPELPVEADELPVVLETPAEPMDPPTVPADDICPPEEVVPVDD